MKSDVFMKSLVGKTEDIFKAEKYRQIIKMLIFSTLVIFSVETLLMVLLELVLNIPEPIVWYIDGFLLVVLLFPLNYQFIVQPMLRQIDEHRRTNIELLKTNEILERFFEISDILVAYMDRDFNFIRVNTTYASYDEHTPDYYVGKNHFDLFPNEENQLFFKHVIETGKPLYIYERPFVYAANPERGTSYWDWSLLPIKNLAGEVDALILVLADRTAHKQAQMALVDSERRFRAVFNQTFQLIGLLDTSGNVIMANQTANDFSGIPFEEVRGKPFWEIPWWEQSEEQDAVLKAGIQRAVNGETVRDVVNVHSEDGTTAVMDLTIKPLLDEDGNPVLLISEARDITDRIRSEEALKRSEEELNRLYQVEIRAHDLADSLRKAALSISSSLNSGTVLDTLLDSIHEVVPFTSAHIELLEDEDHLFVRLARGEEVFPEEKRLAGRHLDIHELPIFAPILKEKKVMQCADTRDYKGSIYFPGKQYIGSWVSIPLLAGDQIIGLVILEHRDANFFTPELTDWATTLTNQAAIAIQNAWLFEQVRDGREHLQALSRRLVEVQESERLYIARELHDEAGQALASLMVGLKLLEREGGDHQAVVERSQELKQIVDLVLENLHRLAMDLRPASLDHLGLVAALRQYVETISDQHQLAIQFEVVGTIERLAPEMETAIYRIVQEALTNIVRHAQATRAGVLLERRKDSILAIVEDNGVGFDLKAVSGDHLGVVGLQERADMLGGTIHIESSAGKGSTIILEVPCPSES